jgi:hypothetical protein
MRALQVSGVVLVLVGVWIVFRPPSYSSEQSVFKLGDIEAKVRQERPVPGWIGGVALGAGAVLFAVGLRRR